MSETAIFSYAKKGFAPDEVDAEYAALAEQLEELQHKNQEALSVIAQMKREITDSKTRLRQSGNEINFNSLGTDLAETLKIAQNRAVDLVRSAEQETTALLAETEVQAKSIIESAHKQAKSMVTQAERDAKQILLQTEKHAQATLLEAEEGLAVAKSRAEVVSAQIQGIQKETQVRLDKISNDTELDRINSEQALEVLKAEIESEIDQLAMELDSVRAGSNEAMRVADAATAQYLEQKAADSAAVAAEAQRKYGEIVMTSEAQSSRLLVEGDNAVRDAKKLVAYLNSSIEARVRKVKGKVSESARDLNAAALRELNELSRRNQELGTFNTDLQMISDAANTPFSQSEIRRA